MPGGHPGERDRERGGGVAPSLQRFGAIDVFFNNAGYSVVGAVEETSDAALRQTLEPMFFGAVALTRRLIPHLRERRSGTIVQITSVGSLTTAPGFGAYCAAKHALEARPAPTGGGGDRDGLLSAASPPGGRRRSLAFTP